MYMLKVIGTFNTEKDLAQYAKNGTQDIGDLIFEDYNKDGTIDVNDYQLVGNYQPDFTFGWNNTFIYKDFDLAVTIDGQCGGNVIYAAARAFSLNRYDDNVLAESGLGRWKSSTDPGNGRSHKAGTNNLGSNIGPSTRYLYDADFLRIRNVSLGYTLPKKFCKIIGIENMRISANVQNLWTFDKYPGYSVEANYEGNSATNNGVDFGGYWWLAHFCVFYYLQLFANQPLAKFCSARQIPDGTKTGQNHRKIKSRTLQALHPLSWTSLFSAKVRFCPVNCKQNPANMLLIKHLYYMGIFVKILQVPHAQTCVAYSKGLLKSVLCHLYTTEFPLMRIALDKCTTNLPLSAMRNVCSISKLVKIPHGTVTGQSDIFSVVQCNKIADFQYDKCL